MKNNVIKRGFLAGTVVMTSLATHAYDLPTVNLGMTSFLDGGLPAGAGWYSQTYLQNYDSNKLADKQGDRLAVPKTDLNYQVIVEQLSYMSNVRVGQHAALGLNFLTTFRFNKTLCLIFIKPPWREVTWVIKVIGDD